MKPRSRVATLAASAVAVGGLALAPTIITAAPAAATGYVNVHVYQFVHAYSSGGSTSTSSCESLYVDGVLTVYVNGVQVSPSSGACAP
jgi:hypothetical protein